VVLGVWRDQKDVTVTLPADARKVEIRPAEKK